MVEEKRRKTLAEMKIESVGNGWRFAVARKLEVIEESNKESRVSLSPMRHNEPGRDSFFSLID